MITDPLPNYLVMQHNESQHGVQCTWTIHSKNPFPCVFMEGNSLIPSTHSMFLTNLQPFFWKGIVPNIKLFNPFIPPYVSSSVDPSLHNDEKCAEEESGKIHLVVALFCVKSNNAFIGFVGKYYSFQKLYHHTQQHPTAVGKNYNEPGKT